MTTTNTTPTKQEQIQQIAEKNEQTFQTRPTQRDVRVAVIDILRALKAEGLTDTDTKEAAMIRYARYGDTRVRLNSWTVLAIDADEATLDFYVPRGMPYNCSGFGKGTYKWSPEKSPTARIVSRLKRLHKQIKIAHANEAERKAIKKASEAGAVSLRDKLRSFLPTQDVAAMTSSYREVARVRIIFSEFLTVEVHQDGDQFRVQVGHRSTGTLAKGTLPEVLPILLNLSAANPEPVQTDKDDERNWDTLEG